MRLLARRLHLIFTSLTFGLSLSMHAAGGEVDERRIDAQLRRADDVIQKLDDPAFEERVKRVCAQVEENISNTLKNQNSVLWNVEIPVPIHVDNKQGQLNFGFYKKDLVEGGALAANVAADLYVHHKLYESRIAHIIDAIEDKPRVLLKLLTDARVEIDEAEKEGIFSRMLSVFQGDKFKNLTALKAYLKQHHRYIGYNPFKETILLPLLARLGIEISANAIKGTLILEGEYMRSERYNAYQKKPDGTYESLGSVFPLLFSKAPISIVSIAHWLLEPLTKIMETYTEQGMTWLKALDGWIGLNLPEFIYSNRFRVACNVVAIGLAIKIWDDAYHDIWTHHVLNNADDFIPLLKRYDKLKRLCAEDEAKYHGRFLQVQKELAEFVREGNKVKSIIPAWGMASKWMQAKQLGSSRVMMVTGLPIVGMIAWKAYKLMKSLTGDTA